MEYRRCYSDYYVYLLRTNLIKYNLLTKRKTTVFQSNCIDQYYASERNVIVKIKYFGGFIHSAYWNGKLVSDLNIYLFKFMIISDKDYIFDIHRYGLFSEDGLKLIGSLPLFDVSNDGKKIIFASGNKIYVQEEIMQISDLCKINNRSRVVRSINCYYYSLFWIPYSNSVLINGKIVLNIDSGEETIVKLYPNWIFILEKTIVAIYGFTVMIYDCDVWTIESSHNSWNYCQKLNILVGDTVPYRLQKHNNEYKLKHVNIGVNYFCDYDGLPDIVKIIMDALCDTIFDHLPSDVLFDELYRNVLLLFVY